MSQLPAVIVVTGAAGALGGALVDALVSRGDRVAAIDLPRSRERLAAEQTRLGERYLGLAIDAADPAAWRVALGQIERDLGPVTGAALVAGGWQGGAALHEGEDDAVYRAMLASNVDSAYRALRALLPGMVARARGSVVVVSSRAAVQPWTSGGAAAYAASKAAVAALVQAVAAEVLASGVRVNAILPSVIDTPANRAAMPDADPSRWVTPASLAGVMAFLLSDAARDVSGALVPVYGRSLRLPKWQMRSRSTRGPCHDGATPRATSPFSQPKRAVLRFPWQWHMRCFSASRVCRSTPS